MILKNDQRTYMLFICVFWMNPVLSFHQFSKDRRMDLQLNYTNNTDLSKLINLITYREWW